MQAPEPIPAGPPAPPQRPLSLPSGGPAWWALVLVVSVVTAQVSLISIQYGCTVALVVVTLGLYVRNRTAGLVAMWLTWLLLPFVRRILLLSETGAEVEAADPLALAPFLVTAVVVALEIQLASLSARARRILVRVAIGYSIGIPLGFLLAPPATAFAFFAYLTAAGCFVIGYREAKDATPVLPRLLIAAAPFLALYAFRQYYIEPLPEWDEVWQQTSDFGTAGSSDQGRIRVWATLNSPGTFSGVMAVSALCYVAARRLTPWVLVGSVAVMGALALTYVRSAWIGVAVTLIALVWVSRGRVLKRVLPVVAVSAVIAPIALGSSTQAALTDRLDTLGSVESDESGGDRAGTSLALVPFAAFNPIGTGLGQAGEPTRLGGGGIRVTDNGYLSLLLQVGPFGFALIAGALYSATRTAWRAARRRPSGIDLLAFAILTLSAIAAVFGDHLYGVGGMFVWYAAGLAVRRDEIVGDAS